MFASSEQRLIPASADEEFSVRMVKQQQSATDLALYLLNLDPDTSSQMNNQGLGIFQIW